MMFKLILHAECEVRQLSQSYSRKGEIEVRAKNLSALRPWPFSPSKDLSKLKTTLALLAGCLLSLSSACDHETRAGY